MKKDFHERKQHRIDRAKALRDKNEQASEQAFKQVQQIASFIPFGQPVLTGHHSEGRHLRDLDKMDNGMRRSVEATAKAEYYGDKAKAIEGNDAIFSDDPDAITKLEEKIRQQKEAQEFMKAANRCIRKQDKVAFLKLNHATADMWEKLNTKDCMGDLGFAHYQLTNNNANIRRMEQRLHLLKKNAARSYEETTVKGVRRIIDPDANRIQLVFPAKPPEEIRTRLKRQHGFRWCGSEGAWQRHLNNTGISEADSFLEWYSPGE